MGSDRSAASRPAPTFRAPSEIPSSSPWRRWPWPCWWAISAPSRWPTTVPRERVAFFFLSFRFAPALAFIIPTFVVFRTVGLYNTHLGLIIMNQLIAIPLIVWTMRSYYEGISHELFESAWIDGADIWETIRSIALPLARRDRGDGDPVVYRLLEQLHLPAAAWRPRDPDDHAGDDHLHQLRAGAVGTNGGSGRRHHRA